MESLVAQLMTELNVPEAEAIEIMKTIAEYVEKQHPLLNDVAQDILKNELEKTKNAWALLWKLFSNILKNAWAIQSR